MMGFIFVYKGYILVEGGFDMGQFITILFGVGFMAPLLVLLFCDDEEIIAKVVASALCMLFVIGLAFFLTGVLW